MNENKKSGAPAVAVAVGILMIAGLTVGIAKLHSNAAEQTALDTMSGMVDERTQLVKEFVQKNEQALTAYSEADEIRNLLCDPDNKALAQAAQDYTETYSAKIEDLEGIYASRYDTCVLTHTDYKCVGMITRSDPQNRSKLHEALESAENGVLNAGIIISPASYRQNLCMYQIVRDEKNTPVGFTGIGISTDQLAEKLKALPVKETKSVAFTMLSAADAKYVFNSQADLIGKATENESIKMLCSTLTGTDTPKDGTLEYRDDAGRHIVSYSYLPEYDWLLVMDAAV